MPNPPTLRKVNPADQPILYLALSSDTMPLQTVDDYGETMLAQRLSTVSGVAQVNVYGSQKRAVRVQINPDALTARNIGIDEAANAVSAANVNLPTGQLDGTRQSLQINTQGQLFHASDYLNLIVAYRNGAPIRFSQLGRIVESVENNRTASWFNGHRAIVLAVQRQPGTNTIEIADAIKKILPQFEKQLPPTIKFTIINDRSESIRASVHDVQFTLILAAALVVMVIFIFLRNASATLIPSLALPISIIGTFGVMAFFGYSLDNLSLMALTLSVGFVVDDAIVMLENIVRHMEEGMPPFEAAVKGAREISFTILSMTASLAAVFLPVLFMGGIMGHLLHEFAVTIIAAIVVSGIVSLTLTPMMCSRFIRPAREQSHGKFYQTTERIFDDMCCVYSLAQLSGLFCFSS
jgi:HAE1 family hydrophobic/amphiphilic exporter-1